MSTYQQVCSERNCLYYQQNIERSTKITVKTLQVGDICLFPHFFTDKSEAVVVQENADWIYDEYNGYGLCINPDSPYPVIIIPDQELTVIKSYSGRSVPLKTVKKASEIDNKIDLYGGAFSSEKEFAKFVGLNIAD